MPVNSVTQIDAAKAISQNAATTASKPKPAEQTEAANQKPAPPKQQPTNDTVKLSSTAKSASEEAKEIAAQTAKKSAKAESLEK